MELGKTETVGVLDDQGIGVGQVDACLDDGGADEDIDLLIEHAAPDLAEFLFAHLAVSDGDLCLRNGFADTDRLGFDAFDIVEQIEYLSAAPELAPYRFVDDG